MWQLEVLKRLSVFSNFSNRTLASQTLHLPLTPLQVKLYLLTANWDSELAIENFGSYYVNSKN